MLPAECLCVWVEPSSLKREKVVSYNGSDLKYILSLPSGIVVDHLRPVSPVEPTIKCFNVSWLKVAFILKSLGTRQSVLHCWVDKMRKRRVQG